jgi:acyl transferase domain-containing protein/NADPH:quinone reductase-like Zn-dependent oxidoreductase/SAM-dependent methyltransferase/acyl carrier protein
MSGRFPGGANSPDLLWEKLKLREDMIGEWPVDRWDLGYFHPDRDRPGRCYTKAGGFLDQIDQFDADFFGIPPREATRLDPQQRLLLELSWEALEDAGQIPKRLAGYQVGVFVGISSNDYCSLQGDDTESINAYSNAGGALSIAANRLSYFYDFHGPSIAIDTACSSSLVAVHEACQSLRSGLCSLALACGVNVLVKPQSFIGFCKASMLSPDGRCKSFDASGNGFVRAEGGVVLVLKPVEAAARDGDSIYGLIVATGVNSDGRTRGLSMPNQAAQEALLREVYFGKGIPPEDVFYVEAHGTGTAVGDPIECNAIANVLGTTRSNGAVYIGSVKSNIGHLEPAAGVAGIAKVLLALKHREIPPNLHFKTPNPLAPFKEGKLKVVVDPVPLAKRDRPYVMGVNSFGFGGTNAHVVIQEYVTQKKSVPSDMATPARGEPRFLSISAQNSEALTLLAGDYSRFLRTPDLPPIADICATAVLRRTRHLHRLVVVGQNAEDIACRLDQFVAKDSAAGLAVARALPGDPPKLALVFCGNGPQWWGMGRELLQASPTFREAVTGVDETFQPLAGWSIRNEMAVSEANCRLSKTEIAQPLLFAIQLGIVAMLRDSGIVPSATVGHSVGEIAAAFTSGALNLNDAVRVIFERSCAQGMTEGHGKMAVIGLSAEAIRPLISEVGGWIEVAAINSAKWVTVAGDPDALQELGKRVTANNAFFQILNLNYAFHSRAMARIERPLLQNLRHLAPVDVSIPFLSTVEGQLVSGTALGAEYWWHNVRRPVQFASAINSLLEDGIGAFLEIGPHPVLGDYIRQAIEEKGSPAVVIPTLRRPSVAHAEKDSDAMSTAISTLYAHGAGANLNTIFKSPARPVALPAYRWQRQRFWNGGIPLRKSGHEEHPLLGRRIMPPDPMWENELDVTLLPYLRDHVVQGATVFPATGYIEMASAAAQIVFGTKHWILEDLEIRKALVVQEGKIPTVQCIVDEETGDLRIRSCADRVDPDWTIHVVGKIGTGATQPPPAVVGQLKQQLTLIIDKTTHYECAATRGFAYGPAFQGLEVIAAGASEALAEITHPPALSNSLVGYCVHPALLDACIQAIFGLFSADEAAPNDATYLPVKIGKFSLYDNASDLKFCHVRLHRSGSRSIIADFRLLAGDGRVLAEIERMRFQRIDLSRTVGMPLLGYQWQYCEPAVGRSVSPNPTVISERIKVAIDELVDFLGRRTFYANVRPRFDHLAAAYAIMALQKIGANEGSFSIDSLMKRGVLSEYRGLLERLVEMALEDRLLLRTGQGFALANEEPLPIAGELWRSLMRDCPDYVAELLLLGRCGEHLVKVMLGEIDPIRLILPEKGNGTIEHLYDSSPSFHIYNRIAAAAVKEIVSVWPIDRRLRVLEIGNGSGGMTASLLPLLPTGRTHHVFTEASAELLQRATLRFAGRASLQFSTLDLERDPIEQGFDRGGFDLIFSTDISRLVSDLGAALQRIRRLLTSDGYLMLVEKHAERWHDMVFGQLRRPDSSIRPRADLLSPNELRSVLQTTGFAQSVVLSDASALPTTDIGSLTQGSVLLAQGGMEREDLNRGGEEQIGRAARGWLLLVDPCGAGAALASAVADKLKRIGHIAVLVEIGGAFERLGPREFVVANEKCDMLKVIDSLKAENVELNEVVHLAGIGTGNPMDCEQLAALQDLRCLSTINFLQALAKSPHKLGPRLTLVTSRSNMPPGATELPNPAQAPLWGLGRVIMNEFTQLRPRLIDLHVPLDQDITSSRLAEELEGFDTEDEVLLTANQRYVNRLQQTSITEQAAIAKQFRKSDENATVANYCLKFARHNIDSLHLMQVNRFSPGPDQVEIRVRAAGLNFRDVMWVMGMLPEEALEDGFAGPTIGMECAGEIVRIGKNVNHFKIGDRVIAFGSSCFAAHMVTHADLVAHIPGGITFEAATTIPTTFFTAYYALEYLAHLAAKERILIHGGAGGVGIAAIQIAKRRNAEIFATAGSDEKRDFLRMLGVDHVFDSRSLAFADEIMKLTGGVGVDVILNSLAGEAIWKNLQIIRPFGRFLEIGKRDLLANSKIGLRPFRNNLSYFGIDADQVFLERPRLAKRLLADLMRLFTEGELAPLPYRSFPIERATEAFRLMQQSRQIGKVVIRTDTVSKHAIAENIDHFPIFSNATYLVTGGLSGFGLATAKWLLSRGAKHLALVGRRGAATEEARAGIAEMEAAGAHVHVFAVDITSETAVSAMMAELSRDLPPLRGVVHAAMVLEDRIILSLDRDRLHRALDPKVIGAWLLHKFTLDKPLDFFVLYSSAATLIGNPGQANYVAGCFYLETLAEYRRTKGLPALTVSWGGIAEVGYLARNPSVNELLTDRIGMKMTSPNRALSELNNLLSAGAVRVGAADFDWQTWRRHGPSAAAPKFTPVIGISEEAGRNGSATAFLQRLTVLEPAERLKAMIDRIASLIGRIVGLSVSQFDVTRPIETLGFDSLMVAEIGVVIEEELGIKISVMEEMNGTVADMAQRLLALIDRDKMQSCRSSSNAIDQMDVGQSPTLEGRPRPSSYN